MANYAYTFIGPRVSVACPLEVMNVSANSKSSFCYDVL